MTVKERTVLAAALLVVGWTALLGAYYLGWSRLPSCCVGGGCVLGSVWLTR